MSHDVDMTRWAANLNPDDGELTVATPRCPSLAPDPAKVKTVRKDSGQPTDF